MQAPDINNKKGDIDVFLKNIRRFFDKQKTQSVKSVHYWGGETLLYWKQIKQTIEQFDEWFDIDMHRITTNGTLIDEEYVEFCNQRSNIFTVVSLHDFTLSDQQWEIIGKLNRFSVSGLIFHGQVHSENYRAEWDRIKRITHKSVPIGLYPVHATEGCAEECWLTMEDTAEYFDDMLNNIYPKACNKDAFAKQIVSSFMYGCMTRSRLKTDAKCFHERVLSVDLFGNVLACHHNDNAQNRLANIFENKMFLIQEPESPAKYFNTAECQKCEALPLCKGGCFLTKTHDVECYWEKMRWYLFKYFEKQYEVSH